ncbi:TIGR01777 family oxidoreductase [Thalassolituus oleivorans]|uniref:TIGR01777 family oxidoreductase n=1 Tax=Thalassolituus oleivorans TaxID=187493 RepID=UPI0030C7A72A
MKQRILITGGTGFIGSRLVERWWQQGHDVTVLTRRPEWAQERWSGMVHTASDLAQLEGQYDRLVNLAGEGIADARWSDSRKAIIRRSRIQLTEQLVEWAQATGQHFDIVLTGSAVGYYGGFDGADGRQAVSEDSPSGSDFSAILCRDWELAAEPLIDLSNRTVILRTGLVLGPNGGMLKRMWLPFQMGLGGVIGSGQQVLSWIHMRDYCRAIDHICDSDLRGAVNMTAPTPATNRQFTKALGKALHRPTLFPMPTLVAKLAFGEMSELLLQGQQALPAQLQKSGFRYEYDDLGRALEDIVSLW